MVPGTGLKSGTGIQTACQGKVINLCGVCGMVLGTHLELLRETGIQTAS